MACLSIPTGGVVAQSSLFEAQHLWVDTQQQATASPPEGPDVLDEEGQIIKALSLGIRDYVHKMRISIGSARAFRWHRFGIDGSHRGGSAGA